MFRRYFSRKKPENTLFPLPNMEQQKQKQNKQENIFQLVSNSKTSISNTVHNSNNVNILCKKVCLFTNARDEKHIKEWAAHHLLIGFDKIIIFDHKSIIPLSKVFCNFDKRIKIINVSNLESAIKPSPLVAVPER